MGDYLLRVTLGELACHFVSQWAAAMVEKYEARAKTASATEDAIKRVSTPTIH